MIKNIIISILIAGLVISLASLASTKSSLVMLQNSTQKTIAEQQAAIDGLTKENKTIASHELYCGGLDYMED